MIRSGRLRHRVLIEQRTSSTDDLGDVAGEAWETVAAAWAAVEPLRGRELIAANQEHADVTTRVWLRPEHAPAITAGMRVNHAGRYYEVASPPVLGERPGAYCELLAIDRGASGVAV